MNKRCKIGGMNCSACSNRVERGIKKLEGVKEANVNLTTETLTVDFDESKISFKPIRWQSMWAAILLSVQILLRL